MSSEAQPAAWKPTSWKEARTQAYVVIREAVWIVVLAVAISGILYLPDQIREIYRITITERGNLGFAVLAAPVVAISLSVWLAAKLVTTDSRSAIAAPLASTGWIADALPALLAALPLLAYALGLFHALPVVGGPAGEGEAIVGKAFESYSEQLTAEFGALRHYALLAFAGAGILLITGFSASRASTARLAKLNNRYFKTWSGLLIGAAAIGIATAIFFFPVQVSRTFGVLGMLAVFMACVLGMTVQLTLLSHEHRLPLIAAPLALAIAFSALDLNDNHEVRRVAEKASTGAQPVRGPLAEDEFLKWYEQRPGLSEGSDEYPVYIVAAQGGGIYAAYQAAIFLARMQDLCPAFKDHLFAISSVSGGSVGAAVFHAALETVAAKAPRPPAEQPAAAPATPQPVPAKPATEPTEPAKVEQQPAPPSATGADAIGTPPQAGSAAPGQPPPSTEPAKLAVSPCPAITAFLQQQGGPNLPDLEKPGPHETEVRRILANDLLSPLIGAMLFTDFTQRIRAMADRCLRPRACYRGELRSRGLADQRRRRKPASEAVSRALETCVQRRAGAAAQHHRRRQREARGRRPVHRPALRRTSAHRRAGAFPVLAADRGRHRDRAAARHPALDGRWPQRPLPLGDAGGHCRQSSTPRHRRHHSIRLVDGGYIDNSGLETALDLVHSLDSVVERISLLAGSPRATGGRSLRRVRLNVIALSGGGYSSRSSFALGETLEPVRAMFSTRQSRAYVAIDRARDAARLGHLVSGHRQRGYPHIGAALPACRSSPAASTSCRSAGRSASARVTSSSVRAGASGSASSGPSSSRRPGRGCSPIASRCSSTTSSAAPWPRRPNTLPWRAERDRRHRVCGSTTGLSSPATEGHRCQAPCRACCRSGTTGRNGPMTACSR